MRVIEKGKKTFLLRTLAALVILAFCAVPMLASSPTYANDKGPSGGGKDSSAGGTVELSTGGDYTGSADCFTAKITPTTVTAGVNNQLFTLTYVNVGDHDSPKLVQFKTTIPVGACGFNDINIVSTTAVSYDTTVAYWTSVWTSPQIISTANNLNTDAIQGSSIGNNGWVQVTFTADTPLNVGYLDLTPNGGTRTAGNDFDVDVTARKCDGTKITNYGGTVHFSSSDGNPYPAHLPGDYHFDNSGGSQDWGYKHFHNGVTLYTAGLQTVTVSDPADVCVPFVFNAQAYKQGWYDPPGIAPGYNVIGVEDTCQHDPDGSGPLPTEPTVGVSGPLTPDTEEFCVIPGEATRLDLTPDGGNTAIAGVPFDVTVTLYDAWDNIATGYLGTVHFSSSDPLADLPGAYPFVPGDAGVHAFLNGVTLYTAGLQTVTAQNCVPPPPKTDTEDWTVTVPVRTPPPPPPPPPAEEEAALIELETTTVPPPVLVVDMLGTITRYPVTADGTLLVDAITTSPDGLVTLLIPRGTLVLNPDGTPAYLNKDPDVFSITAATPQPPAGYTMVAAYEFLPSGITFSPDADVIIEYDAAKVPAGMPVIAFYDEAAGQWTNLETAGYVAGGVEVPNTVQAHTAHLTYFAILAAQ